MKLQASLFKVDLEWETFVILFPTENERREKEMSKLVEQNFFPTLALDILWV